MEVGNDIQKNEKEKSILGAISFCLGIINIAITAIIIWALYEWIYGAPTTLLHFFSLALSYGSIIESFTKSIGILTGIMALLQKNRKRTFATIGLLINLVTALVSIALVMGWVEF